MIQARSVDHLNLGVSLAECLGDCEGMTGLPIVLGSDRSPNETFIQVAGNGIRVAADKLPRGYLTKSLA